jgi:addiction module HigA family antidote
MAKRMHNPPHPGQVLRELWLEPEGISATSLAEALGVSRKTVSAILNARARITADMALRLAKALNTSPDVWLNMQQSYDLWQAGQRGVDKDVKPLVAA